MTFLVPSLNWIARWVLSFAENVEVVHPPELKSVLRERAQRVIDMYNE